MSTSAYIAPTADAAAELRRNGIEFIEVISMPSNRHVNPRNGDVDPLSMAEQFTDRLGSIFSNGGAVDPRLERARVRLGHNGFGAGREAATTTELGEPPVAATQSAQAHPSSFARGTSTVDTSTGLT